MSNFRNRGWRLLAFLASLALGCDLPGKPRPADPVSNFDALYSKHCAGCHGADGKLGPAPPLNDPIFLRIVPDEELLKVITEGRAVSVAQKSPMPAFALAKGGPLSTEQVKVLSEGIKKRWGPPETSPWSGPTYLTAESAGNKDKGAGVFARACAGCHGDQGQDGRNGTINHKAFLSLISNQALRRIVITGRSDLGMPDYRGTDGREDPFEPLTSEETADLVALLAHWRQGESVNGK